MPFNSLGYQSLPQLSPGANDLAQQMFESGVRRGLIAGSSQRYVSAGLSANKLPTHSLDFLTSQSPGWILRNMDDPLTLPVTAIACGVCVDIEENRRSRSGIPQRLPKYSAWWYSFQRFEEHLRFHKWSDWGPLGEQLVRISFFILFDL